MITRERQAAFAAGILALLSAAAAGAAGAGWGNVLAAALIAYTAALIGAVTKFELRLGMVLRATSRGLVIVAVVTVLVLVGIGRSFAALAGVTG